MGRIFSKNAWHVNSLLINVVCLSHTILLSMYTKLSLLITQCVSVLFYVTVVVVVLVK